MLPYLWGVEKNMKKTLTRAFDKVWTFAEEESIDLRAAAMAVSVRHLEKAMLLRGLFPR